MEVIYIVPPFSFGVYVVCKMVRRRSSPAAGSVIEPDESLQAKILQTRVWEIGGSDLHTGKIVRDDSRGDRLRQLPRAEATSRSGRHPFPQRQVACEIYDPLSKPAASLLCAKKIRR